MAGLKPHFGRGGPDLDSWIRRACCSLSTLKVSWRVSGGVRCILAWTHGLAGAPGGIHRKEPSILFGRRIVDGVLFPVMLVEPGVSGSRDRLRAGSR
jgi:hypothetical protein